MSAIDDLLSTNADYVNRFPSGRPGRPKLRLAIVACMDARIDVAAALGLQVGDAHVIRNAGGLITPDVLRSLAISQRALGTTEIVITHHTLCGMGGFDDAGFRSDLAAETGAEPTWDVPGFDDVHAQVTRSVATVRDCRWLPHRDDVRGFVIDALTGEFHPVS